MSSLELFFLTGWRKHSFSPRKEKKKERKSVTKEEQSGVKIRNSQRIILFMFEYYCTDTLIIFTTLPFFNIGIFSSCGFFSSF